MPNLIYGRSLNVALEIIRSSIDFLNISLPTFSSLIIFDSLLKSRIVMEIDFDTHKEIK